MTTPEEPPNDEPGPGPGWDRRRFLAASGAAAGALALGAAACSSSPSGPTGATATDGAGHATTTTRSTADGSVVDAAVPAEATIFGWIEEVVSHGIRRPGYPANVWAESWIAGQLTAAGIEQVHLEPIEVMRWEPTSWSLEATPHGGIARKLTGFPVPFAAPVTDLDVEVAAYDEHAPSGVAGRAALVDTPLIALPADLLATAGSAPKDTTGRIVDPDGTLAHATHLVPFSSQFQAVMEPSIKAGAAAFIGSLLDYPGDSHDYFVPYDGVARPIPGMWLSGSDGKWLHARLAEGPVRIRLTVASTLQKVPSHNVVGELPGADEETVMIASHHDGPWASAVEDGSGISMVLAQAHYWAKQPGEARPHRLVFVLQGGHMSGGAGLIGYIARHRHELDAVVLEVHLEHAALEFAEIDGKVAPTGRPVPRWWFTSRIPPLEKAVSHALTVEGVNRSMILAPDAFGAQPPTDGALYHAAGVPIVQFLEAPFYLFDRMDTLDKIDRAHLVPITRAVIRIVESTRGVTASGLRGQKV